MKDENMPGEIGKKESSSFILHPSSFLQGCRVVLVRPRIAGNLGATARVMRNLGLTELVLVAPAANPHDRQARRLSTQGQPILDNARIVPELAEAVADCVLVAATSARVGGLCCRQSVGTPEDILPRLVEVLAHGEAVALVFGTEASGLTNAEISRCHFLIHIPTAAHHPALNLAQAVAICLYELRRFWLKVTGTPALPCALPEPARTLASFAAQEHLFGQLQQGLEEIHFLYGPKAEPLMHGIRHLLGRAQLTEMEVDLLLGLARQIRWFVDRHKKEG